MGTLLRLTVVIAGSGFDCSYACHELGESKGQDAIPKSKDFLFDSLGRSPLRSIATEAEARSPRNAKTRLTWVNLGLDMSHSRSSGSP